MSETKPNEVKPRKVVGRSVAIALGIVCILLIAGLGAVLTYYTMRLNERANYAIQLETWLQEAKDQKSTLQNQMNDYVSSHSYTNSQYSSLMAPKLLRLNPVETDQRPWFSTPYLQIQGIVVNVGSNAAYSCRLHVVAYQSGGVVAIDTYIDMGNINGESYVTVNTSVYYQGSSLTSWAITPQWTATP
jgi:hypothetical protein